MKMDSNKLKWARWADLESLFNCSGQHQKKTCYETSYKPGKQQKMDKFEGKYVVKRLSLVKYLFMNNLEFPRRESRCCKCNFWRSQNHLKNNYRSTCLCWEWIVECSAHERRILCKFCSHFAKNLLKKEVDLFQKYAFITFDLANKGQIVNWCSIVLT